MTPVEVTIYIVLPTSGDWIATSDPDELLSILAAPGTCTVRTVRLQVAMAAPEAAKVELDGAPAAGNVTTLPAVA